jgi:hypothetical protein
MGSSVPGRVARSNSVEEFHDHCNTADASHDLVCKQLTPLVIKEIADIVWRTQARAEELPSGDSHPLLTSGDEDKS